MLADRLSTFKSLATEIGSSIVEEKYWKSVCKQAGVKFNDWKGFQSGCTSEPGMMGDSYRMHVYGSVMEVIVNNLSLSHNLGSAGYFKELAEKYPYKVKVLGSRKYPNGISASPVVVGIPIIEREINEGRVIKQTIAIERLAGDFWLDVFSALDDGSMTSVDSIDAAARFCRGIFGLITPKELKEAIDKIYLPESTFSPQLGGRNSILNMVPSISPRSRHK